jgi:hypothetical protein
MVRPGNSHGFYAGEEVAMRARVALSPLGVALRKAPPEARHARRSRSTRVASLKFTAFFHGR